MGILMELGRSLGTEVQVEARHDLGLKLLWLTMIRIIMRLVLWKFTLSMLTTSSGTSIRVRVKVRARIRVRVRVRVRVRIYNVFR